jgi:hypothetical protein
MTDLQTLSAVHICKSISAASFKTPKSPLLKVLKVTKVAAFQLECGEWPAAVSAYGN